MKLLFFVPLIFLFISCASSSSVKEYERKKIPLPPGVEYGQVWKSAEEYGYEETIYTLPEYVAVPKRGNGIILGELNNEYTFRACRNAPNKIHLRYIVDKAGSVVDVLPNSEISESCFEILSDTIHSYEFYPALHNDEPVYILALFPVSRNGF